MARDLILEKKTITLILLAKLSESENRIAKEFFFFQEIHPGEVTCL